MKKNIGGAGSGIYKDEKSGTWAFRVVRDKNYRRIGFRTRAQATAARLEFIKNLDTPAKNRRALTG